MGPLIAIVAIVLVVLLVAGGYLVGGFVYAQGRINSAGDTYNSVIDHQNGMADFFNSLTTKLSGIDLSNPTKANVDQAKTSFQQLVDKSTRAQPQIDSDDASLAQADTGLKQNSWLTVLSKPSLDQRSAKIEDLRAALAAAKTIVTDYQQYGGFTLALLDCVNDLVNLETAGQNRDLSGMATASSSIKTDATKAIGLDHAPGLAPEVDTFMHDLSTVADDFTALINAATTGNQAAITTAENALDTDGKKLDSFDFTSWDTTASSFYQGLIDQYNSDISKANNA